MTGPATPGSGRPGPNRWRHGFLLVPGAAWVGLVTGTALGALRVPEGSGLAGPVIALGYGVLAAVALATGAGLAAWRAPTRWLRPASVVVVSLSLLVLAAVAWRFVETERERRARAGLDFPLPAQMPLTLVATLPEEQTHRSFRRLEVEGRDWSATWTAVGPGAPECRARLTGVEAGAVQAAIQAVEARHSVAEGPCADEAAPALEVSWGPRGDESRLAITAACRDREAALGELYWILWRIPIDATESGRTECAD